MSDLIPLVFEEHLVRAVRKQEQPWFVGKDVCACLGLKNPNDALSSLDGDEKGVATTDPLGRGGEQTVVVISEPGVYRLVFRSRKPEAERFKRWLAHDVLPALRRTGRYEAQAVAPVAPQPADAVPESAIYRLNLVREARLLFGHERARCLWRHLGLPPVPPAPPTERDDAAQCLRHLLDAPAHEGGPPIRNLLEAALDDDETARAMLIGAGIRPLPDRDAFTVSNQHPRLAAIFAGTDWLGRHGRVIRRLAGIAVAGPTRIGGLQRRGSLVPAAMLEV